MKAIIKRPFCIKENTDMFKANKYKLFKRINFYRNTQAKLGLIKLFIVQYNMKRLLKKLEPEKPNGHSHHHHKSKDNNGDEKITIANVDPSMELSFSSKLN